MSVFHENAKKSQMEMENDVYFPKNGRNVIFFDKNWEISSLFKKSRCLHNQFFLEKNLINAQR